MIRLDLIFIVLALASPGLRAQDEPSGYYRRLARGAVERTKHSVRYEPAYVVLKYPGGDVPADTGVCTDVVIRAYRAMGLDLQVLVHQDMRRNFSKYPKKWGLSRTDRNIDHRRVPNLQVFFGRHGKKLSVSDQLADYRVGDIVAWDLNGKGLTHIGIVVPPPDEPDSTGPSAWIVHNIGYGPVLEQRLFEWKIIGHYRFGDGVAKNYPVS